MKYASIIFVQGDDYNEAEAAADVAASRAAGEYGVVAGRYAGCREWVAALFAHLQQWDMGEATSDDVFGDGTELSELRTGDRVYFDETGERVWASDDNPPYYVLTWDTRYCVAGLYRRALPDA